MNHLQVLESVTIKWHYFSMSLDLLASQLRPQQYNSIHIGLKPNCLAGILPYLQLPAKARNRYFSFPPAVKRYGELSFETVLLQRT